MDIFLILISTTTTTLLAWTWWQLRKTRRDLQLLLGEEGEASMKSVWSEQERTSYRETTARVFRSIPKPEDRKLVATALRTKGNSDAFHRALDAMEAMSALKGIPVSPPRPFFRALERTTNPNTGFSQFRREMTAFLAATAAGSISPNREDWVRVHAIHTSIHELEDVVVSAQNMSREQKDLLDHAVSEIRSLQEALTQERSFRKSSLPASQEKTEDLKKALYGEG